MFQQFPSGYISKGTDYISKRTEIRISREMLALPHSLKHASKSQDMEAI